MKNALSKERGWKEDVGIGRVCRMEWNRPNDEGSQEKNVMDKTCVDDERWQTDKMSVTSWWGRYMKEAEIGWQLEVTPGKGRRDQPQLYGHHRKKQDRGGTNRKTRRILLMDVFPTQ